MAKYKNDKEIEAKTILSERITKSTTRVIRKLAAIIIFFLSTRSANKPAKAINKKLGAASERIIPETAKLLPVLVNTDDIKEISKNPEAACPRSKVKIRIKKFLLFRTSI